MNTFVKNNVCYFEEGFYCGFDQNNGVDLSSSIWIPYKIAFAAYFRLQVIGAQFKVSAMRSEIPNILNSLFQDAEEVVSRDKRFPDGKAFVRLDHPLVIMALRKVTAASSFKDFSEKSNKRTAVAGSNGINATTAKYLKPEGEEEHHDKLDLNDANQSFNFAVSELGCLFKNEFVNYNRERFEKYHFEWVCGKECCPIPYPCVPCRPCGKVPKVPDSPIKFIESLYFHIKTMPDKNNPEHWIMDKERPHDVLECNDFSELPSVASLYEEGSVIEDTGYVYHKQSEVFVAYFYKIGRPVTLTFSKEIKCENLRKKDLVSLQFKALLDHADFVDYDVTDPRLLLGEFTEIDCDLLNSALVLRANKDFKIPKCGLVVLHKKNAEEVSTFYYDTSKGQHYLLKTIDCHLDGI